MWCGRHILQPSAQRDLRNLLAIVSFLRHCKAHRAISPRLAIRTEVSAFPAGAVVELWRTALVAMSWRERRDDRWKARIVTGKCLESRANSFSGCGTQMYSDIVCAIWGWVPLSPDLPAPSAVLCRSKPRLALTSSRSNCRLVVRNTRLGKEAGFKYRRCAGGLVDVETMHRQRRLCCVGWGDLAR